MDIVDGFDERQAAAPLVSVASGQGIGFDRADKIFEGRPVCTMIADDGRRITHVHVKDKTLADKNVSFGAGDTPIKEVLQAIRDNKWNIQATIEFEYPAPPGSDRMAEMAKCVQYCTEFCSSRIRCLPPEFMRISRRHGPEGETAGGDSADHSDQRGHRKRCKHRRRKA